MYPKSFYALSLSTSLMRVLEERCITKPTDIQSKTIPHVLTGRDVVASAETGSGKTAVFMLPRIERLQQPTQGQVRAQVLAPTRELALQTEAQALIFSRVGHDQEINRSANSASEA